MIANKRGVPFRITFDQWWDIWQQSGQWSKRGNTAGCYVMSRFEDQGSYEIGNVSIIPVENNISDAHSGKAVSAQTRRLLSRNAKVQKRNQEGTRWST